MSNMIQTRIQDATGLLATVRSSDDLTTKALGHVLAETCDLAKVADHALDAALPSSAAVLARACYERMILAKWIVTDERHAEQFSRRAHEEAARQLRKLLNKKRGTVRNRRTGKDTTITIRQALLLKELSRRPTVEELAREAELEDIHDILYGPISMQTHAATWGLPVEPGDVLGMAGRHVNRSLQIQIYVLRRWFTQKQRATRPELLAILNR